MLVRCFRRLAGDVCCCTYSCEPREGLYGITVPTAGGSFFHTSRRDKKVLLVSLHLQQALRRHLLQLVL